MLQISYGNFFHNTSALFVSKPCLNKCNRNIKHSSGVYKITNNMTGDCYIGKSKDIFVRIGQHKSLLKSNKHKYRNGDFSLLQKAWNKYGEKAFSFDILELCTIDELDEREIYWIDFYQCNHAKTRHGYNTTDGGEGAYGNSNVKGRIQINNGEIQKMVYPEEFEYYQSIGFKRGVLPSVIDKINKNRTILCGEDHWNYGKHLNEETKKKMSDAHKGKHSGENGYWYGKHLSEEHKRKIGRKSLGRKHSDEEKKKISEGRKKPIVQLTKDGEYITEFPSGLDAEIETGINRGHISDCCKGKRKTTGGYMWRFKSDYVGNL